LELLTPALRRATVDAFCDYPDPGLPATLGFEDLRRRADNPQNAMAVSLDLSDPAQRETLSQVAAWTIHAEIFGQDGELATFHDCGSVITACLSAEEARTLTDRLGRFNQIQVVTLEEWRHSKKAARRQRLARFFRRRH